MIFRALFFQSLVNYRGGVGVGVGGGGWGGWGGGAKIFMNFIFALKVKNLWQFT